MGINSSRKFIRYCSSRWIIKTVFHVTAADCENKLTKSDSFLAASTKNNSIPLTLKSRNKSTLPTQIGAIIGAYVLSVFLVCVAIYMLATRVRLKLRIPQSVSDIEMVEHHVTNNFNTHDLISISANAITNFSMKSQNNNEKNTQVFKFLHKLRINCPKYRGLDKRFIKVDRENMSQNLEDVNGHVTTQEEAKVTNVSASDDLQCFQFPKRKDKEPEILSKQQPSIEGGKQASRDIYKFPKPKVISAVIPKLSSILFQVKLSKAETNSADNMKISSPIFQKSMRYSVTCNDQSKNEVNFQPTDLSIKEFSLCENIDRHQFTLSLAGGSQHKSRVPEPVSTGSFDNFLPLRQYGTNTQSISFTSPTKTTVIEKLERPSYLETGSLCNLRTTERLPYSPYQPLSMTIPVTPILITKEDMKRRKKLDSKKPVIELVKSEAELWDNPYE